MFRDYPPLVSAVLQQGVGYAHPAQALPEKVKLDDLALSVMTDFKRVTARSSSWSAIPWTKPTGA